MLDGVDGGRKKEVQRRERRREQRSESVNSDSSCLFTVGTAKRATKRGDACIASTAVALISDNLTHGCRRIVCKSFCRLRGILSSQERHFTVGP